LAKDIGRAGHFAESSSGDRTKCEKIGCVTLRAPISRLRPSSLKLSKPAEQLPKNFDGAVVDEVIALSAAQADAVEGVRKQLSGVEQFVALEGPRDGWLNYEGLIESEADVSAPVEIDEDDLITINYTSGTTARPKGVMITHRNAYLNVLGTLAHFQMSPEDRYLWTLPMFHANGWTFVWTVTARGSTHVCLRKVDPTMIFELVEREAITTLCAAPTVHRSGIRSVHLSLQIAPPRAGRP
jgi:fatty-acyl-CoA synthase